MMKLRRTKELSPSSMIIEPPHTLNGTDVDPDTRPRWRHMKCVFVRFVQELPSLQLLPSRTDKHAEKI